MISAEIFLLFFCAALLSGLAFGLLRMRTPRKVGFEGIEDPNAAEAYDRLSRTPQFRLIRRYFVNKLKQYAVEGIGVDIGCGPGYLLQLIAKEFPQSKLIGVDISTEMVNKVGQILIWLG